MKYENEIKRALRLGAAAGAPHRTAVAGAAARAVGPVGGDSGRSGARLCRQHPLALPEELEREQLQRDAPARGFGKRVL
jgi:hypothetical protein